MTVVVIIGVLISVAMAALGSAGDAASAGALARAIQFALMRARAETLADGAARRLSCTVTTDGSRCQLARACAKGVAPDLTTCPVPWIDVGHDVVATSRATLWSISDATDRSVDGSAAAQWLGTHDVVFRPDGTADPATFYVADKRGTTGNHYKVYVFAGTGMARLVDRW